MSKKLSELPLTQQIANDGTIVLSSASEGSKRIDFETFLQLIGGSASTPALDDLNNVVINNPVDRQVLGYDAHFDKWTNIPMEGGGGGGSTTLSGLQDVSLKNPTNNQVLKYNSSTRKWENKAESGGGGGGGDGIILSDTFPMLEKDEVKVLAYTGTIDMPTWDENHIYIDYNNRSNSGGGGSGEAVAANVRSLAKGGVALLDDYSSQIIPYEPHYLYYYENEYDYVPEPYNFYKWNVQFIQVYDFRNGTNKFYTCDIPIRDYPGGEGLDEGGGGETPIKDNERSLKKVGSLTKINKYDLDDYEVEEITDYVREVTCLPNYSKPSEDEEVIEESNGLRSYYPTFYVKKKVPGVSSSNSQENGGEVVSRGFTKTRDIEEEPYINVTPSIVKGGFYIGSCENIAEENEDEVLVTTWYSIDASFADTFIKKGITFANELDEYCTNVGQIVYIKPSFNNTDYDPVLKDGTFYQCTQPASSSKKAVWKEISLPADVCHYPLLEGWKYWDTITGNYYVFCFLGQLPIKVNSNFIYRYDSTYKSYVTRGIIERYSELPTSANMESYTYAIYWDDSEEKYRYFYKNWSSVQEIYDIEYIDEYALFRSFNQNYDDYNKYFVFDPERQPGGLEYLENGMLIPGHIYLYAKVYPDYNGQYIDLTYMEKTLTQEYTLNGYSVDLLNGSNIQVCYNLPALNYNNSTASVKYIGPDIMLESYRCYRPFLTNMTSRGTIVWEPDDLVSVGYSIPSSINDFNGHQFYFSTDYACVYEWDLSNDEPINVSNNDDTRYNKVLVCPKEGLFPSLEMLKNAESFVMFTDYGNWPLFELNYSNGGMSRIDNLKTGHTYCITTYDGADNYVWLDCSANNKSSDSPITYYQNGEALLGDIVNASEDPSGSAIVMLKNLGGKQPRPTEAPAYQNNYLYIPIGSNVPIPLYYYYEYLVDTYSGPVESADTIYEWVDAAFPKIYAPSADISWDSSKTYYVRRLLAPNNIYYISVDRNYDIQFIPTQPYFDTSLPFDSFPINRYRTLITNLFDRTWTNKFSAGEPVQITYELVPGNHSPQMRYDEYEHNPQPPLYLYMSDDYIPQFVPIHEFNTEDYPNLDPSELNVYEYDSENEVYEHTEDITIDNSKQYYAFVPLTYGSLDYLPPYLNPNFMEEISEAFNYREYYTQIISNEEAGWHNGPDLNNPFNDLGDDHFTIESFWTIVDIEFVISIIAMLMNTMDALDYKCSLQKWSLPNPNSVNLDKTNGPVNPILYYNPEHNYNTGLMVPIDPQYIPIYDFVYQDANPSALGLWEYNGGLMPGTESFILTSDTSVVNDKIYYTTDITFSQGFDGVVYTWISQRNDPYRPLIYNSDSMGYQSAPYRIKAGYWKSVVPTKLDFQQQLNELYYDIEFAIDNATSNILPKPTNFTTVPAAQILPDSDPAADGWFEFDDPDYIPSEDITVDDTKTYYMYQPGTYDLVATVDSYGKLSYSCVLRNP